MPEDSFEEARRRHFERLARSRATLARRMAELDRKVAALKPGRRKRRPGKDKEDGGVPAVPDRPRDLSGGAAAELDYES